MRKLFLTLLFPGFVMAQSADQQSMLDAESAFAELSKQAGTPAAFLQFLTDEAVTFGQDARIGKEHYASQKNDGSWLSWAPAFSDISASGDFGYNTGPWEVRLTSADPEPVAFGQFVSVWKKVNGEWKVALDVGISHAKPAVEDSFRISAISLQPNTSSVASVMQRVVAEEQKFIHQYHQKKMTAFTAVLSQEGRVLRQGSFPLKPSDIATAQPVAATYKYLGGDISPAGDLAYVYGKALIDVVDKGVKKPVESNYVRIWKKEDGKNWKIVVDVITYL